MNLPRGYLSWTQMDLWHKNRAQYQKSYYAEKGFSGNKYTAYGTEVHKMIESGEHPFTNMPDFEVAEQKIEVNIGEVPILAFIDGFSPSTNTIFELKTSKRPWTQYRVDTHGQLVFYAMAVHEKFGSHDPSVTLVWMETEDIPVEELMDGVPFPDTRPELTGHMEIFKRNIGDDEIAEFRQSVVDTAYEIAADYENFRNSLILD